MIAIGMDKLELSALKPVDILLDNSFDEKAGGSAKKFFRVFSD